VEGLSTAFQRKCHGVWTGGEKQKRLEEIVE